MPDPRSVEADGDAVRRSNAPGKTCPDGIRQRGATPFVHYPVIIIHSLFVIHLHLFPKIPSNNLTSQDWPELVSHLQLQSYS